LSLFRSVDPCAESAIVNGASRYSFEINTELWKNEIQFNVIK
jgi:hypothetical protein